MKEKRQAGLFLVNMAVIFVVFFFGSEHTLISFINTVFYVGLIYVVTVLFMFTVKGGFFDGLVFGFRRYNHIMFKRKDYLEEWKKKPLPSESFNIRLYRLLQFQCYMLVGGLIVLLIIYYMVR
ncbi:DUF3899 domain-containing protein [Caldibacillus thermoamylovorans]|jgi:hypothetical protein|uniref:DUF3899 domain-containing protein n=2 Tax=Bacillaceae TaxID=186817 RepID=UPI0005A42B19|nr:MULTISPECIES: DUF3899 domain-containing protein [Bacillaceae]MCB5935961.1 DUF3899 domain-containing protein [Bacillus sp. DFI.2.34]NWN97201.1 DUF3899 domain-containing protein [Bacillus sp. (in: firmicutes)]AWI14019.1 DUF3899 domain-containing protein [Caldibacillus thermoamylovorans]MCB7070176.1 DUF3899 domain-containing protein [Caldibacillus sp. 210928-DFI.2.22]MCB7073644.1 DUF3899 domain-containing protein [Caldibacillus sp. 210928-DFI.2.18]